MSNDWSRRRTLAVAGAALLAGCSGSPPSDEPADGDPTAGTTSRTPTPEPTPVPEPDASFTPEEWSAPTDAPTSDVERTVLVENLEVPWDVSVADNGDLFVTERVGRVSRVAGGDLDTVFAPEDAIDAGSIAAEPQEQQWWVDGGEGGTLGVAVHPDYPDVEVLYVYYTASLGDDERVNRVSRFDLSADDPAATERVVVGDVAANKFHNGGRIAFGPRGYLWITTGDAGEEALAADPGELPGSVLRVTANGEPAPDNPDIDGGDPRVFTYGHRNPQGLVWLPDGTPVATEHGPAGRDEVNRLVPGGFYGWPDARTAEEYGGLPEDSDVRRPLANTGGSTWAPTGALWYTGETVPSWRNRLIVGGLSSQQLIVVTLSPPETELPPLGEDGRRFDADWLDDGYTATAHPMLTDVLGRIRHVEQGVDGELYAITSNRDGRSTEQFPKENHDVLVRLEASE